MTEVMSLEWFQNYTKAIRKAKTENDTLVLLALMAGEIKLATVHEVLAIQRQMSKA
jgi:hypothetical protein